MRAETSNPTARAARKAGPDARSRSATASAAGSTVPLAGVPARQRRPSEGADEHAIGESGAGHVRAPIVPDNRSLVRTAEIMHDGHDASSPGLPGSHEAGSERVEDGDLAVLHESMRQIG